MMWRRIFKCPEVLGRPVIYSFSESDQIIDGELVEGAHFEVKGTQFCQRFRWHRGEHFHPVAAP